MNRMESTWKASANGAGLALRNDARQVKTKRAGMLRRWKEELTGYLFLGPSLALFAVFLFYPLGKTMYLSLHLTDPRGRIAVYVGIDNYRELFTSPAFWSSLKVTGLFTLYTVPVGIALALLLAVLADGQGKARKAFQFIFSLPVVISVGTGAVIWMLLFHPTTGMLNYGVSKLGIAPIQWLTNPDWALVSISIMTVWMNLGFHFILLLSGLRGIPQDMYESARIDGAGPFKLFTAITVPLLTPTLFFVSVISIIGSFQAFGQIHILTKGGPVHSTDVLVYSIYQDAFVQFQFGTGSAKALVLFAIILLLTIVQFRFVEKKVHYQ